MKKTILIFLSIVFLTACGAAKKSGTTTKQEKKKTLILPPDVNSNKYSKKRNRN